MLIFPVTYFVSAYYMFRFLRNCQISGEIPPYLGSNLQGLRQLYVTQAITYL